MLIFNFDEGYVREIDGEYEVAYFDSAEFEDDEELLQIIVENLGGQIPIRYEKNYGDFGGTTPISEHPDY